MCICVFFRKVEISVRFVGYMSVDVNREVGSSQEQRTMSTYMYCSLDTISSGTMHYILRLGRNLLVQRYVLVHQRFPFPPIMDKIVAIVVYGGEPNFA